MKAWYRLSFLCILLLNTLLGSAQVKEICGDNVPQGWITIAIQPNCSIVGNTSFIGRTIKKYDELPVGTELEVCGEVAPAGWITISVRSICATVGKTSYISRVIRRIDAAGAPPGTELKICGDTPPKGWITTSISPNCAVVGGNAYIGRTIKKYDGLANGTTLTTCGEEAPAGWIVTNVQANCSIVGNTAYIGRTIKKVDLQNSPAGTEVQICGETAPLGWITTAITGICARVGSTNFIGRTIKKIDNLPEGSIVNICGDDVPNGWIVTAIRANCASINGVNYIGRTIKKINMAAAPAGTKLDVCGTLPPPGWITVAINGACATVSGVNYIGRTIQKIDGLAMGTTIRICGDDPPAGWAVMSIEPDCAVFGGTRYIGRTIKRFDFEGAPGGTKITVCGEMPPKGWITSSINGICATVGGTRFIGRTLIKIDGMAENSIINICGEEAPAGWLVMGVQPDCAVIGGTRYIGRTIKKIDLLMAVPGSEYTICGERAPSGWITTKITGYCATVGGTNFYGRTIKKIDGLPDGSMLTICGDAVPQGWVATAIFPDCAVLGGSRFIGRVIKKVDLINSPAGTKIDICGEDPPSGWITTAITGFCATVGGTRYIGRTITKYAGLPYGAELKICGDQRPEGWVTTGIDPNCATLGGTIFIGRTIKRIDIDGAPAGTKVNVCGDLPPSGWVTTAVTGICAQSGGTRYFGRTIMKIDNMPNGSVVGICGDTAPAGWVVTGIQAYCASIGGTNFIGRTIKRIDQSAPGTRVDICGETPPAGWVTIAVNGVCARVGGTDYIGRTIFKLDPAAKPGTKLVICGEVPPPGYAAASVNGICASVGATNFIGRTIFKIDGYPKGTIVQVCGQTPPPGWITKTVLPACAKVGGTQFIGRTIEKIEDDKVKTDQYITFNEIPAATYGDNVIAVTAVASSGLPVALSSSDPKVALIVSNTIRVVGAGTAVITATQAGDNNYAQAVAVSQTLNVKKAVLNVKADDKVKVYGAQNPVLSATYSGFIGADNISVLSARPQLTTQALNSSSASDYLISASGGSSSNYEFELSPGKLTVQPAPLTLTADNKTKAYGSPTPTLTYTFSGLVNNDTPEKIKGVSISTSSDKVSTPGTYAINISNAQDGNYLIKFVPGTLTVTKAKLTVIAEDKTRFFGYGNPPLTLRYSGWVNDEPSSVLESLPQLNTSAVVGSAPGNYPITATGGQARNYQIEYKTGTLSVVSPPKPVIRSVTPLTAKKNSAVAIEGEYLFGTTTVKFGNVPAASFQVRSANKIDAVVGEGATGDVSVSTMSGSSTFSGFIFLPLPVIASVSPMSAPEGGSVVIKGHNLLAVNSVSFGGVAARSFKANSNVEIIAVVGAGTSGEIAIAGPGGTASLTGFVYLQRPSISSIEPQKAGAGEKVVIIGKNFERVSRIELGGTAVSSFVINSSSKITAVVGNGASGDVSVVSTGGIATFGGFIFQPPPTIFSISPKESGVGGRVEIIGKDLIAPMTIKIGGVLARSFTSSSSTTITAVVGDVKNDDGTVTVSNGYGTAQYKGFRFIPEPQITIVGNITFAKGERSILKASNGSGYTYQWFRDGSTVPGANSSELIVTESGDYKVRVTVGGWSATTTAVKINVIFTLPNKNFKTSVTSASCKGEKNGAIDIIAQLPMNYVATIEGMGVKNSLPFTQTATFPGLGAGKYNVCITLPSEPAYRQCYTLTVNEPKDLVVYASVNKQSNSLDVTLNGADQYTVELNGVVSKTDQSVLSLPLRPGANHLVVHTDKACQGREEQFINLSDNRTPYPNPFENELFINLSSLSKSVVEIRIFSLTNGRLVFKESFPDRSGVIRLDVALLPLGLYALHLIENGSVTTFKIIKK